MFGRKKITVPQWAGMLKPKQYAAFLSAVEQHFTAQGAPYTIEDGIVYVKMDDVEADWQYGLDNLVQVCAQVKPQDYPEMIAHHFQVIAEGNAFLNSFDFDDFASVKPYLGVRLYDRDYVEYAINLGQDTMIRRPFAGDLFSVLVFNFPHSIQTIATEDTEKWGKAEDELFAMGIDNIRRDCPLEPQEIPISDDKLFLYETEHFFASNILFDLEQNEQLVGRGGAIVAVPTRSTAMIYPIYDLNVVEALNIFFHNAPACFMAGPGSLSREIFWYQNGQYESLDFEPGRKVKFTPSENFLALLNELEQ
ncbi:MAG: hypothetical protein FWD99_07380 [Oscillospiraceae bacterium]|nr:hypothetical protein [Oscillospiraceae bacterium]